MRLARYKTKDGRRVRTAQAFNGRFGTFVVEAHTLSLHRYKSKALPMRDRWLEAQADLDAYAEKMKWEKIDDE